MVSCLPGRDLSNADKHSYTLQEFRFSGRIRPGPVQHFSLSEGYVYNTFVQMVISVAPGQQDHDVPDCVSQSAEDSDPDSEGNLLAYIDSLSCYCILCAELNGDEHENTRQRLEAAYDRLRLTSKLGGTEWPLMARRIVELEQLTLARGLGSAAEDASR